MRSLADELPAPCGGCDVPLFRTDPWIACAGAFWCIPCATRLDMDVKRFADLLRVRWETGGMATAGGVQR